MLEDIPALRAFTAQTYEQAKGVGWADALHPEDVQHTFEVWNRAVSTKTSYETEYRMRRHDGVYRLLLARGVPVLNEQGNVVEWVGTCIDITDRKRAEEKLRKESSEIAFANRILQVFVTETGDDLFDKVLDIVLQTTASRHGVFGYIAEPGHLICPSLSKMLDVCEVKGKCIHYPPEKWKGLWARALKEKRSLFTNEAPRNVVPKDRRVQPRHHTHPHRRP